MAQVRKLQAGGTPNKHTGKLIVSGNTWDTDRSRDEIYGDLARTQTGTDGWLLKAVMDAYDQNRNIEIGNYNVYIDGKALLEDKSKFARDAGATFNTKAHQQRVQVADMQLAAQTPKLQEKDNNKSKLRDLNFGNGFWQYDKGEDGTYTLSGYAGNNDLTNRLKELWSSMDLDDVSTVYNPLGKNEGNYNIYKSMYSSWTPEQKKAYQEQILNKINTNGFTENDADLQNLALLGFNREAPTTSTNDLPFTEEEWGKNNSYLKGQGWHVTKDKDGRSWLVDSDGKPISGKRDFNWLGGLEGNWFSVDGLLYNDEDIEKYVNKNQTKSTADQAIADYLGYMMRTGWDARTNEESGGWDWGPTNEWKRYNPEEHYIYDNPDAFKSLDKGDYYISDLTSYYNNLGNQKLYAYGNPTELNPNSGDISDNHIYNAPLHYLLIDESGNANPLTLDDLSQRGIAVKPEEETRNIQNPHETNITNLEDVVVNGTAQRLANLGQFNPYLDADDTSRLQLYKDPNSNAYYVGNLKEDGTPNKIKQIDSTDWDWVSKVVTNALAGGTNYTMWNNGGNWVNKEAVENWFNNNRTTIPSSVGSIRRRNDGYGYDKNNKRYRWDSKQRGWIPVEKNGGVLKAQWGNVIPTKSGFKEIIPSKEGTIDFAKVHALSDKANQTVADKKRTNAGIANNIAAAANIGSVVLGFIPGLSLVGAGAGALGSIAEYNADTQNPETANGAGWRLAGNLALDALSAIPILGGFAKAGKLTKAGKLAKTATAVKEAKATDATVDTIKGANKLLDGLSKMKGVSKAATVANAGLAGMGAISTAFSLGDVFDGDKTFDTQDFLALSHALQSASGLAGMGKLRFKKAQLSKDINNIGKIDAKAELFKTKIGNKEVALTGKDVEDLIGTNETKALPKIKNILKSKYKLSDDELKDLTLNDFGLKTESDAWYQRIFHLRKPNQLVSAESIPDNVGLTSTKHEFWTPGLNKRLREADARFIEPQSPKTSSTKVEANSENPSYVLPINAGKKPHPSTYMYQVSPRTAQAHEQHVSEYPSKELLKSRFISPHWVFNRNVSPMVYDWYKYGGKIRKGYTGLTVPSWEDAFKSQNTIDPFNSFYTPFKTATQTMDNVVLSTRAKDPKAGYSIPLPSVMGAKVENPMNTTSTYTSQDGDNNPQPPGSPWKPNWSNLFDLGKVFYANNEIDRANDRLKESLHPTFKQPVQITTPRYQTPIDREETAINQQFAQARTGLPQTSDSREHLAGLLALNNSELAAKQDMLAKESERQSQYLDKLQQIDYQNKANAAETAYTNAQAENQYSATIGQIDHDATLNKANNWNTYLGHIGNQILSTQNKMASYDFNKQYSTAIKNATAKAQIDPSLRSRYTEWIKLDGNADKSFEDFITDNPEMQTIYNDILEREIQMSTKREDYRKNAWLMAGAQSVQDNARRAQYQKKGGKVKKTVESPKKNYQAEQNLEAKKAELKAMVERSKAIMRMIEKLYK